MVAEKLLATVSLGIANSRMKDFHDLWTFATAFSFDGAPLCEAVRQTFARRRIPLPMDPPIALTPAFAEDATKATQWRAFVMRTKLVSALSLDEVVRHMNAFAWPLLHDAGRGEVFEQVWQPGGPWKRRASDD